MLLLHMSCQYCMSHDRVRQTWQWGHWQWMAWGRSMECPRERKSCTISWSLRCAASMSGVTSGGYWCFSSVLVDKPSDRFADPRILHSLSPTHVTYCHLHMPYLVNCTFHILPRPTCACCTF